MTSAEQVARLLALVPYLQSHPDAELGPTAAGFGVTAQVLLSDLGVLWYCGLPGGLPGDLIEIDMDQVVESAGSGSPTPATCPGRCASLPMKR